VVVVLVVEVQRTFRVLLEQLLLEVVEAAAVALVDLIPVLLVVRVS